MSIIIRNPHLNAVSLDISQKHSVYFKYALASLGFRGLTLMKGIGVHCAATRMHSIGIMMTISLFNIPEWSSVQPRTNTAGRRCLIDYRLFSIWLPQADIRYYIHGRPAASAQLVAVRTCRLFNIYYTTFPIKALLSIHLFPGGGTAISVAHDDWIQRQPLSTECSPWPVVP